MVRARPTAGRVAVADRPVVRAALQEREHAAVRGAQQLAREQHPGGVVLDQEVLRVDRALGALDESQPGAERIEFLAPLLEEEVEP